MSRAPSSLPQEPEYAWEVATLFPEQGYWSEERYLELTDSTNRRIEWLDGRLEFLPMPTEFHQALAGYLYHVLRDFVAARDLGKVPFPPLRIRVDARKIRQPECCSCTRIISTYGTTVSGTVPIW